MTGAIRLQADVQLKVIYADRTASGGAIGNIADETAVEALWAASGSANRRQLVTGLTGEMLNQISSSVAFRRIAVRNGSSWHLRDAFLHPKKEDVYPAHVAAVSDGSGRSRAFPMAAHKTPALHQAISCLSTTGCTQDKLARMPAVVRGIVESLVKEGFASADRNEAREQKTDESCELTFIGHNSVVLRSSGKSILFDPYFFEPSPLNPPTYQPLQLDEIGTIDAVAITHSHRDHFDPASLLRIPPETPIVVPSVERESILALDMAYRLTELGFTNVTSLKWYETIQIGDFQLKALPFFGEQPTDSTWLHPDIRNQGCTYFVTTPTWSVVLLADSGRDNLGNVKELASKCRREHGPVDLVVSGYRGWLTYPAQLLSSSVARYALFVPPKLWETRMQLMSSVDDALDVAERWGARYLCPYGDGGAPWYWRNNLGPRLDGLGVEDGDFDPFPERVIAAAQRRWPTKAVNSTKPEVVLLRPGQSLRRLDRADRPEILQSLGHCWPF